MKTNNKTFWELICEYKINIPIIQRDYAQGRIEEKEKRNKFLNSISKCIESDELNIKNLSLDFIYGRINNEIFLPIDGQQRLTTLFLLHWYFLLKSHNKSLEFNELIKFEYDTRISSREFCNALIKEKIIIPIDSDNISFKESIKNTHWYRRKWDNDPTIASMLNMIQAIHEKFKDINPDFLYQRLIKDRAITFEVLDLGEKGFELTDELYIKMNARGKQLTSFENFKANFIQFIEKNYKGSKINHPDRKEISYSEYFSFKIEKEWTDLLWEYRGNEVVIDKLFLNYFSWISEILFFQSNLNLNTDAFTEPTKQYQKIFNKEENLLFLFDSLDKMYDISLKNKNVNKVLISEFFNSFINSNISTSKHINLFVDKIGGNNLFENVISNGRDSDINIRILLYLTLKYLINYNQKLSSIELKDFVRVIRNILQSIRQLNDTKFNSNIRINNWGNYWKVFEKLISNNIYNTLLYKIDNTASTITDKSLLHEKNKAELIIADNKIKPIINELEEFKHFKGLIHILEPKLNASKLNVYKKAIKEIWDSNISDTIIIQSLIINGFYGLKTKRCNMGDMWFFGKKEIWNTILTIGSEKQNIGKSVLSLLDNYLTREENTPKDKLNAIINSWRQKNTKDRSWKHYFIKYSSFTSGKNYFVKPKDFSARMLGTLGSNPLLASHINPYVLTICKLINDKSICVENDSKKQYTGYYPLLLKNGITLASLNEGWKIDNKDIKLDDKIIKKYKLKLEPEGTYLLEDFDDRDRIEIAVDFIKEII